MSSFLLKVAEVLEAAAAHIDAVEAEKKASIIAEKTSIINSLANKFAEATGEEMPDSIKSKLASSDNDVVNLVKSMVEKQASAVDSLGSPAEMVDGNRQPQTVKEAAELADERFLNWIIS